MSELSDQFDRIPVELNHKITVEISDDTKAMLESVAATLTEAEGDTVTIEMVAAGMLTAQEFMTRVDEIGEGG